MPPKTTTLQSLQRRLTPWAAVLCCLGSVACASSHRGLKLGSRRATPATRQAFETMKQERRVALVIGNGRYAGVGSLKNPPNDADLMARTLESLGFSVTAVKNADWDRMQAEAQAFERRLKHADIGLFYFAGHGVQRDDRNYLVPTEPAIVSAEDFEAYALHLGTLMDAMRRAGPRMNIIILDACRNDPFPRSTRTAGMGLGEPENAAGTVVAYAAAKGRIAKDGVGEHSPYTKSLVLHMRRPNVEVGSMLRSVFADVDRETGSAQQPWYEVAVKGQFYFNLGDVSPPDLDPSLLDPATDAPTLIAGGAAVAGFAGALTFGAMALQKNNKLSEACERFSPCPTEHRKLQQDRDLYRTVAWGLAGVGTIALGTLWWLLSHDASDEPAQRSALRVSVGEHGEAAVGLGGAF